MRIIPFNGCQTKQVSIIFWVFRRVTWTEQRRSRRVPGLSRPALSNVEGVAVVYLHDALLRLVGRKYPVGFCRNYFSPLSAALRFNGIQFYRGGRRARGECAGMG